MEVPMYEWASDADREAYARDVTLHGRGIRQTTPDGKWRHIPLYDFDLQHPREDAMPPIAQLIAELRERASKVMPQSETGALLTRAAEALARQEELLAEARADIAAVCEISDEISNEQFDWYNGFWISKAAARLSDKLKGE